MALKETKSFILYLCCLLPFFYSCKGSELQKPDDQKLLETVDKHEFKLHKDGEPFDTYHGLVMAGYQGWFCSPEDDCPHGNQWYHYQSAGKFEPGVLRNSIDFWPDVSEYEKTYEANRFILPNGDKAKVYSAYDKSSVMLHFKWMKDYGLDGVFMQRFVGEVIDNRQHGKDHFDKVLESAMEGSNVYTRAICVMYDLSGARPVQVKKTIDDAQEIMDKYQLRDRAKQKFYLHENGKPLIAVWGVGFNDNRPYSLEDVEELIDGLKEKGFSIMLGVPTYWRERKNDALPDIKLHELIKKADVIMPWFVGRYDNSNYSNFHGLIEKDIAWCKSNAVGYAPLCFPGYADRNMHPNNSVRSRHGGDFLWKQMYHCIKSGAEMLYIAMFDEIDEGTAIYKCLNENNVPGNKAEDDYWVLFRNNSYSIKYQEVTEDLSANEWCRSANSLNVTFQGIENNLPTDHYLWVTQQGGRMLRGEIPMTMALPVR